MCAKARRARSKRNAGGRPAVAIELGEHRVVVGRRHDDQHVAEILGRGAHQARAADVDLLDQIVELDARLGGGLDERIEIDDDQIDEADAVLLGELRDPRDDGGARGCRRGSWGAAS